MFIKAIGSTKNIFVTGKQEHPWVAFMFEINTLKRLYNHRFVFAFLLTFQFLRKLNWITAVGLVCCIHISELIDLLPHLKVITDEKSQ